MNKKLARKMLTIGGTEISQQVSRHIARITEKGKPWPITGRIFVEGRPGECHENVARYWLNNQQTDIVTGYALVSDQWILHSWLWHEERVIETTHAFDAYFGVRCSKNESRLFCLAELGERAQPLVIAGLTSNRERLSFLQAINERKPEKTRFVSVFK
jgi:hypothetical protein